MTAPITSYVHGLIDGFVASGQANLKSAFADRLALWTVMTVLGLPIHDFPTVRGWFTDIAHAWATSHATPLCASVGRLPPPRSGRTPPCTWSVSGGNRTT